MNVPLDLRACSEGRGGDEVGEGEAEAEAASPSKAIDAIANEKGKGHKCDQLKKSSLGDRESEGN